MNDGIERQYLDHLRNLIKSPLHPDRTGTGTRSIFGHQMRHDLRQGFPLLTTKRTPFRLVARELLWFLSGNTNINYLNENNVGIWDEWATEDGDLGPIYGSQWRNFNGVDQIQNLINTMRTEPHSRRMLVSAWNPSVLPDSCFTAQQNVRRGKQALPPCHVLFQVHCEQVGNETTYADLMLFQRSADWFLGVPFNIASYSLLLSMLAQICGYIPRMFVYSLGDTHLYENHVEQALEQLQRQPRQLPFLHINPEIYQIDQYDIDDFAVIGYEPHAAISAPISV